MKKRMVCLLLVLILAAGTLFSAVSAAETETFWPNFRGSDVNNGLTDAKTPASADSTELKWATKLMTGWTDAPSVQIIADNALVVMHGAKISKLDLKTGEILVSGTLSAAPSFGYTPPAYADGMIFCPLGGGVVEAVDAKTLESQWIYKDELGGQALSAITCSEGRVYTGFWNSETKDANYVCLNAADGSLVWKKTVAGGFYWAGSVVVGDALIVGTDDGANGFTGDSHLFSLNKNDGSVISDITVTGCGDQRSAVVYSAEKGRVYFTAKGGYLCSAALDAATGKLSDLKTAKQAAQCTSTPVVYGDQVYFSSGSGVVSGNGGSGNFIVADADTLEQLYAVPLLAYPQGSVLVSTAYLEETGKLYCYSTYNGQPGGLTLIKVDPTKNTADGAEKEEIFDAKGYEQYCITSPICGPDGTIYYKNDSGCVLAVGANLAYLTGLTANVGFCNGEIAAEMEWIVPAGTESVTFTPIAPSGASVTVNGAADGAVALTDGTATAVIRVTMGNSQRDYTVSIREISSDATLGALKGNESNSYGSFKDLSPEFTSDVVWYLWDYVSESRSFVNIWPDANHVGASVKVFAVRNVQSGKYDEATGEIAVTAVNQNHNRYAIYFADDTMPMAIRIAVTAEDGTVQNYHVIFSKSGAAEAAAQLKAELEAQAAEEAANRAAADSVMAQIDAIGVPSIRSEAAILAARQAYDALTDAQKALVTNYAALTDAEQKLEELKNGDSIRVYVTISNAGQIVMGQQAITVKDYNGNGFVDVDDVLYAAHEAGYSGGAAAGYDSAQSQYGLSIVKLWGDESGAYGYWCNDVSCWSLEDAVQADAHVVAFVYQDTVYWSDAYTRFESMTYIGHTGAGISIKLDKAGYDADFNTVFSGFAGATITAYDSDFHALAAADYTVTDNGDGTYTVTFKNPGSYYLAAYGMDAPTVPALSQITVEAGQSVPDAGDSFTLLLVVPVVVISAVLLLLKKKGAA